MVRSSMGFVGRGCFVALLVAFMAPFARAEDGSSARSPIYPVAVLAFQERGEEVQGYGAKVADLLFANLAAEPTIFLVDRQDLQRQLAEQELSLSGLVRSDEAVRVGNLTGAKILVTGSILQIDSTLYLVGKVIGTETSRVVGVSAKSPARNDLGELAEEVAEKLIKAINERADELVAKPLPRVDRIGALRKQLDRGKRPSVWINVAERHIGQSTIDPAAETEITMFCRELGFPIIDSDSGSAKDADLEITGEGITEFAARHDNLISVRGRLEVKVVDRATNEVVAIYRHTTIGVDLSEQIAGKTALQEAAARAAVTLIPKLANAGRDSRK